MADDVQPTLDTDQAPHPKGTLSIQEAAAFYGVTEKTIRRRIKALTLKAVKHPIAEGFEWRVYPKGRLDRAKGTQSTQDVQADQSTQGTQDQGVTEEHPAAIPELMKALEMLEERQAAIDQLQAELRESSNAAAHWQARAVAAEQTVQRLLPAPKDEPETPAEPEPAKPWWKRIWGG